MKNVMVLSGSNHNFAPSAEIIHTFLNAQDDISSILTDDKAILTSSKMDDIDVLVLGTGFTRSRRLDDGSVVREADLSAEQEAGLFEFVRGGKGLAGLHGTAWWIGGPAVDLIGGHSNWHPPGSTFTVNMADADHAITHTLDDFEVEDEIYISAHEPDLHILATAEWHGKAHHMAWVKSYGEGRVFYSTLGHGPGTFERAGMQALVTQGVRWAARAI